jgi:ssRNA-specific RNase YbeY (16S rRNA maturation enzyme)
LLDLNDKAVLNVCLNRKYKGDNNVSVYFSSDAEIEKLQMQLDMKDKVMLFNDRL